MPKNRRGWAMGGGTNFENRHSPLAFPLLEPALLIFLKEQPRHGYTLLGDLETLGIKTMHPSIVYRALREMEVLGWIESNWDAEQTQGPPRRTYRITAQGEEALKNWGQELARTKNIISQLLEK